MHACGWRFGAVVLVVRRGRDGQPPLVIESQRITQSAWRYRAPKEKKP
jgi:hypothetical protein